MKFVKVILDGATRWTLPLAHAKRMLELYKGHYQRSELKTIEINEEV
ncbi:MAG TPA: hypothetical protein VIH61_07890 [Waddliaceae bacterium]